MFVFERIGIKSELLDSIGQHITVLNYPANARPRRKIRLIESNAKCCYLKNWPLNRLCGRCLYVCGPLPS
jgi:hypothetical protein